MIASREPLPGAVRIERVRSFNRTVMKRLGAPDDEHLARGRPLGAPRVLWELGEDGR